MRWWPPVLHLALIGAVAVLALVRLDALEVAATVPDGQGRAGTTGPAQSGADAPDVGGQVTAVDLDSLSARPLFQPGRQPVETVVQTESPTPESTPLPPPVRMLGYLNDGNRPRAILSLAPDTPDAILQEGEEFQGFKVLRIGRDQVVLRNEGKEITVNMFGQ